MSTCHICKGTTSDFEEFKKFKQITSDCQLVKLHSILTQCNSCGAIQKKINSDWLEGISNIYSNYSVYCQSNGQDQLTFDSSGASSGRSLKIINLLCSQNILANKGSVLDVGCGNGVFLEEFGKKFPAWRMSGSELNDKNKTRIESIAGVENFFIGLPKDHPKKFDLIVMIHSLEHIVNPIAFLNELKSLLAPGGYLFIQVPDLYSSPFDILIFDHCTHFESHTLSNVLFSAGFNVFTKFQGEIPKELSFICMKSEKPKKVILPIIQENKKRVIDNIDFLKELIIQAKSIYELVGIFGTSIAATWLFSEIEANVDFFIDEDINRSGLVYLGRNIYDPINCPKHIPILIPLTKKIGDLVFFRLKKLNLNVVEPIYLKDNDGKFF